MANISKPEFERVAFETCSRMVHPWHPACPRAWLQMLVASVKGSCRFFAIIYALQIVLKNKNISSKFLLQQLKLFPRSVAYGASISTLFSVMLCMFRHAMGRYYLNTSVYVPGFIAGLSIFIENPKMRKLDAIMFFNMVLQLLVRAGSASGSLPRSRLTDTLCFMAVNSLLMHLLNTRNTKTITNLWFFNPIRGRVADRDVPVRRDRSFVKRTLKESTKYFAGAFLLQGLRTGMPRRLLQNPLDALRHPDPFKFGAFVGCYVAVYRLACRVLPGARWRWCASGACAGAAYALRPDLSLALVAFTTCLQLLLPEGIARGPSTELLFSACCGLLLHSYIALPEHCPAYVKRMVHVSSSGLYDKYLESFLNVYNRPG